MFKTKIFTRGAVVLSTIALLLASTATMASAATLSDVIVTPGDSSLNASSTWTVSFSGAGTFDCVKLTSTAIATGSATITASSSPATGSVTTAGVDSTGTSLTVETYNGGCAGTLVDTGTTAISIQPDTTVRLTVDGSFTFTVDARTDGSACGAVTSPITSGVTATDLNLGALQKNVKKAAVNDLVVSSNAVQGWTLDANVSQMTGPGTFTETAFDTGTAGAYGVSWGGQGAYSFPGAGGSTYTVASDTNNDPTDTSTCMGFQAQPGAATPAGAYSSTVKYTAIPKY